MQLAGLSDRAKYIVHYLFYVNKLDEACATSADDVYILQANMSCRFTRKVACNVWPTCTPKGNWILVAPSRKRFSWIHPREYWWCQSLDFADYFSPAEIAVLHTKFSYQDLVRFSGNSFQARVASAFVASALLLKRLENLGEKESETQ